MSAETNLCAELLNHSKEANVELVPRHITYGSAFFLKTSGDQEQLK